MNRDGVEYAVSRLFQSSQLRVDRSRSAVGRQIVFKVVLDGRDISLDGTLVFSLSLFTLEVLTEPENLAALWYMVEGNYQGICDVINAILEKHCSVRAATLQGNLPSASTGLQLQHISLTINFPSGEVPNVGFAEPDKTLRSFISSGAMVPIVRAAQGN